MPDDLRHRLKEAYAHHRSGRLEAARGIYLEILAQDPFQTDANNLMGLLCIESKKPLKAIRYIRRALENAPESAQSYFNLGIAFKDLGRMQEAASAFQEAAGRDENNSDYSAAHGNALRLAGRYREAAQSLENATRRSAGHRGLRHNLALAQNDLGASLVRDAKPRQAVQHFMRAIEINPHHAEAHLNLGLTLEQLGELGEAANHYGRAIAEKPDFADAHFQLAHLRTHPSSSSEIDAMRRLLDAPETGHGDRIRLAYGLGFALESIGRYDQAFAFMHRAHVLQAAHQAFDIAAAAREFERIKRVFNVQRLMAPEASGPPGALPILIVGMPRSGTTLVEQVISSHPQVSGLGESMALARSVRNLGQGKPYPEGLDRLSEKDLTVAANEYLSSLSTRSDRTPYVTDTTPMNFRFIGLAAMMLPGARFVLCTRDPLDNCLSIYRQMLTGANQFAHDLEDLGAYYRMHSELLEHWTEALGNRIHKLRYEDIVRDHERQVKRLLDFCELPFDERCLKFYDSDRAVRSPSAAQVRQPIYDTSIGFWKNYEHELLPLRRALRADPTR